MNYCEKDFQTLVTQFAKAVYGSASLKNKRLAEQIILDSHIITKALVIKWRKGSK